MPLDLATLAGGFAERAGEELIGFGVGTALGRGLEPEATLLAQEAWRANPSRALDMDLAANAVAEGIHDEGWGATEAELNGWGSDKFAAVAETSRQGPSVGELLTLWRRGAIGDAELVAGLKKQRLDPKWHAPIQTLKDQPLLPAELAVAIQRGIVADPGLLPVGPPSGGGTVPPMPQAEIDALKEAEWSGLGRERIAALTRIVGLPPGPGELLQLLNRGHINETDYLRGIAEGNTRNEWGPTLLNLARRVLPSHTYAELHLRGWIDQPTMEAGAKLTGVTPDDVALQHKMIGRSLAVHQVQTGTERGGSYNGPTGEIPEAFIRAVEQSNIRPEWYNLAYANRHTLPSAFVIRSLLTAGELTAAEGEALFLQSGWPPDLAKTVAERAAKTKAGPADPHVTKAQTQLWATIHKSYVAAESDAAEAGAALTALGVPADAHGAVLALWDHEREIVRRSLTPSQIKKAFTEAKFTREEAAARLERLGMAPVDADLYLSE